jgi:sec-independent protein translocase protein TatA
MSALTSAPLSLRRAPCAASSGARSAFAGNARALACGPPRRAPLRSAARRDGCAAPRRQVTTCGLFGLGLPELVVIGGVVAVLFGPSKLPELGKTLGKTVKSFQGAAKARHPPG